jgi:glutaminase
VDLESAITKAYDTYLLEREGKAAEYLTALSHTDSDHFGIAAMKVNGDVFEIGDTRVQFSIQSISKVFTLLLAFEEFGLDRVYERVSAEPSGAPYNELSFNRDGKPFNPMINSGAITIAGMLFEAFGKDTSRVLLDYMNQVSGGLLHENEQVKEVELLSGDGNMAIAYLLRNNNLIPKDIESVIGVYNSACAIEVDAQDLAALGGCLASGGIQPKTREVLAKPLHVQHVLSIMLTCGMYNGAGRWAVDIGVPAKSGVAGGLLASVVGRFGLGVYSTLLDLQGNSVRGIGVANSLDDSLDIHAVMPLIKPVHESELN